MEFCLNCGRVQLDDVNFGISELLAQREDERVHRRLGSAVVWTSSHRHQSQAGSSEQYPASLALLTSFQQERHERLRKGYWRKIVRGELLLDHIEVDGIGLAEIDGALDAGVQED